ncbi:Uu.00g109710.m01.CDS01 [Anthostomella pinea]|uniref:Uu.00g109710.m01.CDS01 n=1 Tax=Anthostomella pinea TaxID=933095 RepID=A0AAI8VEN5_9PEZI|nr:Uu.00g109710.m01.CDS01 [Anthostomella pinea]
MLFLRLHNTMLLSTIGPLMIIPTICARQPEYMDGLGLDGVTRKLALDRTPALFTGDFGDCLGGESLLNVTRFDAAFYYDNSTILFHLDGSTNIRREDLMLFLSFEAYGEGRYNKTIDPCSDNISSMCPLNASRPIEAFTSFQVNLEDVSGIPQIAYEIPDLEGNARIQIFANSTQAEIGCFQAVLKNGHTFSQVWSISPVLGVFTIVAVIASFATAAYGVSIPHMRTHYAHSLSVLVIFETFQSIFYSGALSLNWPSVLPAWWSNFAWSAGLIPVSHLVHSIDSLVGVGGNASQVGAAGSTILNNEGGLRQLIYGRSLAMDFVNVSKRLTAPVDTTANLLSKSQVYNPNNPYGYNWDGDPVKPGMPLPGNWTGFAGELSKLNIPAPNAFMVGLIWLLVAIGLVVFLMIALKSALEGLVRFHWIKKDRLDFFRSHWTGYLALAVLRTLFIAFFSITTLAMYQFSIRGSTGPIVVSAFVFVFFILIMGGMVLYALHSRLRSSSFASDPDRILLRQGKMMGCIPYVVPVRVSQLREQELNEKPAGSLPFIRWHFVDSDTTRRSIHQDELYVKRFGWLSARYRLSRWWFFALWLAYQFIRAGFLGGASGSPLAQVFGLFIVDILALLVIAALNPFEGQRNTALAVWLLGISKVATTGLPWWDIFVDVPLPEPRNFSSRRLEDVRIRYYEHIEHSASDIGLAHQTTLEIISPGSTEGFTELPKAPHFSVSSVRRTPKIEDEDEDYIAEMNPAHVSGITALSPGPTRRLSRTGSTSSRHSVSSLPRAARMHRVSWSSRDFCQLELDRPSPALKRRLSSPGYAHTNPASMTSVVTGQLSVSSSQTSAAALLGSRPMTAADKISEEHHEHLEGNEADPWQAANVESNVDKDKMLINGKEDPVENETDTQGSTEMQLSRGKENWRPTRNTWS